MKPTSGIDPGKNGAIAMYSDNGMRTENFKEQSIGTVIRDMLGSEDASGVLVYLESVHAFPGQGVSSSFAFGCAFGEAKGTLEALGVPYRLVTPQRWQKMILGLPKKKDGASAHKRALKLEAQRRFPSMRPTLSDCDAILIAEYGASDRI